MLTIPGSDPELRKEREAEMSSPVCLKNKFYQCSHIVLFQISTIPD